MKQYLMGWNFLRLLRLGLGILIIAQGVQLHNWMYIIAGSLFSLMPIFNIGCCAAGNCAVPRYKQGTQSAVEKTTFEEVK